MIPVGTSQKERTESDMFSIQRNQLTLEKKVVQIDQDLSSPEDEDDLERGKVTSKSPKSPEASQPDSPDFNT